MASTSRADSWFFGGYSKEDIKQLMFTFAKLRTRLEDIAVTAFTQLYDQNKEAFDVFINNNMLPSCRESIANSPQARQHCVRVIKALEMCASKLDNEQAVSDYILALSKRHCGFGIKGEHFISLIGCLRNTIFEELYRTNTLLKKQGHFCHRSSEIADIELLSQNMDNLMKAEARANSLSEGILADDDVVTGSQSAASLPAGNDTCKAVGSSIRCFDEEMAVWNKFFLTMSLAMVNSVEIAKRQPRPLGKGARRRSSSSKPPASISRARSNSSQVWN